MSLISIIVILLVAGILLWLVETQIPLDATIKRIIHIVVIIVVVLWLLSVFGLIGSISNVRVPQVR